MSSIPRRLQKINFLEQDAENIVLSEDGLQGPPKIDNILPRIPHESTSQIKIIWPNGEMRQIVGVFRNKFLSTLNGGKIIVETDQNGVPNERSGSILSSYLTELAQNSTIAPLHIPRWDNEMFKPKQHEMIKHVEVKFVYPPETTQLTRDWILMTLAKKWRAYKSCLKKKYYNRDARTLDEILKDVPRGANEHQRLTLVGIWCQDSHMELLPGKCTRVKEDYANSSFSQEDGVTKEAHMEIHVKEHQDCVRHEKVTKQQLCLENYSKGSYANSSLGCRCIIAMKANNENSTKSNQGFGVPSFPHNQPTNKVKRRKSSSNQTNNHMVNSGGK